MQGPDAFDGEIERLFARPPVLNDGDDFARRVEKRLNQGWRLRAAVVGAAGVVGGVFAVREALASRLSLGLSQISSESAQAADAAAAGDWGPVLAQVEALTTGSGLSSMPLFWLVSAVMIGAAAATALKSSLNG